MSKALVLITGGNNGLGYFAAQQLAATGDYHVIIGSRDAAKGARAIAALAADRALPVDAADLETVQLDVTSDASLEAAAAAIAERHGRLDVLMSNAGISQTPDAATRASLPRLRAAMLAHYDTNVAGATLAVEAFLPLLRKSTHARGKRVAFTSSGLASLALAASDDGLYSAKNFHIYRSSKTALNMLMLYYARSLESEGFVVAASDPGYCATDLNGHSGLKDPREGAKVLVEAATGPKERVHGVMIDEDGTAQW